ncbi:phosphonate C-P lyase system protein PhnG [uncultured Paracoccus sp.]|uniref:phosphonate C-P lyase system protein PhnG n=1 Tax=uncultured Paracoccus sp. TaxID=189685 RepID=UPI0025E32F3E|nr:phosphonate C-P lyase system protein PhnG [uncultured Paracoccus sp.]
MSHPPELRRDWMSLLAKAPPARLAELAPDLPPHDLLRAPEIGAIMLEGRIGGTGGRFNLGEMTVTRCSVRLGQAVGHACVQGRDKDHARRAAVLDALMQGDQAPRLRDAVLTPLQAEAAARATARAEKAAATRVEFFTLMRGED